MYIPIRNLVSNFPFLSNDRFSVYLGKHNNFNMNHPMYDSLTPDEKSFLCALVLSVCSESYYIVDSEGEFPALPIHVMGNYFVPFCDEVPAILNRKIAECWKYYGIDSLLGGKLSLRSKIYTALDIAKLRSMYPEDTFKNYIYKECGTNLKPHLFGDKSKRLRIECKEVKSFIDTFSVSEDCKVWSSRWPEDFCSISVNTLFDKILCGDGESYVITLYIDEEKAGSIYINAYRKEGLHFFVDPIVVFDKSISGFSTYNILHVLAIDLAIKMQASTIDFFYHKDYKEFLYNEKFFMDAYVFEFPGCDANSELSRFIQEQHSLGKRILLAFDSGIGTDCVGFNMSDSEDICIGMETYDYRLSGTMQTLEFYIPDVMKFLLPLKGKFDFLFNTLSSDCIWNSGYVKDFFTSKKSTEIELNREFGKAIAEEIGLHVPLYKTITSVKDYDKFLEEYSGDKVALKLNKEHFIGIFDVELARSVVKSNAGKELFVEEYLGTCENEYGYSFFVDNGRVIPVVTQWETNRMFPNGKGGKSGSTSILHSAHFEGEAANYIENMSRLYDALGHKIFGIVEFSVMVKDGIPYFVEWMVRPGCTNFALQMAQIKTPLIDMISDPTLSHLEYRAPYCAGLDLFVIPLDAGSAEVMYVESGCFSDFILNDRDSRQHFFNLDDCLVKPDKKIIVNIKEESRIGTCVGLGDSFEEAIHNAKVVADSCNIPNVVYADRFIDCPWMKK